MPVTQYDYDLFVIGGGSGGVRAARLAGGLGKKVAIAEEYRYGGTCVIRGCVPKKLLVYASQYSAHFIEANGFGWTAGPAEFSWRELIAGKDREISRLEGLYRKGLLNAGAELVESRATVTGPHTVRIAATGQEVSAERILIATGGWPNPHRALPGYDLCITSNEAFHLDELPKDIVIAGGGYIAVEFACIFAGLGSNVTLVYRGMEILSRFDGDMRRSLHAAMEDKGIRILCHEVFEKIERGDNGRLVAYTSTGKVIPADQVMLALGRDPQTDGLGLESAGVETGPKGEILVDAYSRTNVESIYAIGDVTDRVNLTPVAIHEAMCFIDTVYRDRPVSPDYDLIATAVFSQPEIGTVGMSEEEAGKAYADVEVYKADFRPMKATLSGSRERMLMKIVVDGGTRKVLGVHILGHDAGEMAQTIAIALKAGATKDDFDRTMAVHPTAAEELVTTYQPSYRLRDGKRV